MEIDNKAKSTLSLLEYIGKLGNDGKFLIPDYQRGYIWGQHSKSAEGNKQKDSVSYLIETLLHGFLSEPRQENIFLQGITVWENKEKNEIAIIDGQQRTTFFFLLLKYLGFDGHVKKVVTQDIFLPPDDSAALYNLLVNAIDRK